MSGIVVGFVDGHHPIQRSNNTTRWWYDPHFMDRGTEAGGHLIPGPCLFHRWVLEPAIPESSLVLASPLTLSVIGILLEGCPSSLRLGGGRVEGDRMISLKALP